MIGQSFSHDRILEMATGHPAFAGGTTATVFEAILNRNPTPPSELNRSLPDGLSQIVSKLLEKDRRLRYQSATTTRTSSTTPPALTA